MRFTILTLFDIESNMRRFFSVQDIMPKLIPVQYHKKTYPANINPSISEVAGHFDVVTISTGNSFSLHTEYSYGKRKLNSPLIRRFSALTQAHRDRVPQLWLNEVWSREFAEFLFELTRGKEPIVIEIHPPFSDYTLTIHDFLNRYEIFEEKIRTKWPLTKILIENRSGTIYRGGKFLISRGKDLLSLVEEISENNLSLKIALDFPQLFSAYGGPQNLESEGIGYILHRLSIIRSQIAGIHLWGKRRSASGRFISHNGDLNSYFENDAKMKEVFLTGIYNLFDDNKYRFFVPEVNSSSEDLHSIVHDLELAGFEFR